MSPERSTRLPAQTLALYALPTAGMTSMHWLIMVFLLKFSTDTLGIEPRLREVACGPASGQRECAMRRSRPLCGSGMASLLPTNS